MKIGPLESKPPVAAPAATERAAGVAPLPNKPEASAQVDLSPEATLMAGMGSDPTFDTAKVDRIAQAIRDGQFKINPEAIADKLIQNAEELLGRKFS